MIQTQLFKVGNYNFQLKHLLILVVLILSFSISLILRSQVLDYGYELNEFDPFFNFRATEFLLNNGLLEYFDWHDVKSWYPNGRDISATSQVMLHVTAAITYQIFGSSMELYDFTILFPGIIGALTAGRNEDLHREISDLRVQRELLKEEIFRLTKPKKRPYKRRNYKKKPPQKNK